MFTNSTYVKIHNGYHKMENGLLFMYFINNPPLYFVQDKFIEVYADGVNIRVRVNGSCSERFEVTVGVHQGSVLSLSLFAVVNIVLVALRCFMQMVLSL